MSGRWKNDEGVVSRTVDTVFDLVGDTADAAKGFLASPEGRRLRRNLARVAIIGAPLIAELPLLRRSFVGRLLGTAALATVVVKGAEWLRDWQPGQPVFGD